MAELLPEFVVSPPPRGDQAFAPAPPLDLAPFAPKLFPSTPGPPGSALAGGSGVLTALGGLLLLLFPTSTGPREFDEAPTPPAPPPPRPPGAAEPIEPPNWDDLSQGGDERLLDPIQFTGMPFPVDPAKPTELPEFVVSPPRVTPSAPPLEMPLDPLRLPTVFGGPNPYGFAPDYAPSDRPGSAPAPFGAPGFDPLPGEPFATPFGEPGIRTSPLPSGDPAPNVFGSPLPDLFGDTRFDPAPAPRIPTAPGPRTGTPTPTGEPTNFFNPVSGPSPLPDPTLVEFGPNPQKPASDTCQCDKKPKPKKEKRKDRSVCYRGTYVQRTKGISYNRIEQVPCESAPKKPKAKRTPKLKPGQFPGMSLTGGQWVDLGAQAVSEFAPILLDYLEQRKQKSKPKKEPKPKKARPRRGKKTISPVPRRPGGFETVFV